MPIKLSRLLVAFVLALAIPLQGMASVAAGVCMAMGHHEAGAPASHHDAHGSDADHSAPHDHDTDGSESPAHCAPCVACCAAASIAPAAVLVLPEASPMAALSELTFIHPGFLPEKLDRPPLAL